MNKLTNTKNINNFSSEGFRSKITQATDNTVTNMPMICCLEQVSDKNIQANKVESGAFKDMIKSDKRGPISTKDANKHMSPINKPTTPEGFTSSETKTISLDENDIRALEKLTSEENFEQYKMDALAHPGGSIFMKIRDTTSDHYIEVYFSEADQDLTGKTAALIAKIRSIQN